MSDQTTAPVPVTMEVPQLAQLLGKSTSHVYALIREDAFPTVQVGNRKMLSRAGVCEVLGLDYDTLRPKGV